MRFQAPMHQLVLRGRSVDIRAYEIANVDRIVAELQPTTLALLHAATTLLGEIIDGCQQLAATATTAAPLPVWSTYLPFERAIDATMANLGSHQIVDEIAFIAQLELRQREERLERLRAGQGSAALLGECDSSLRRIRKALTAVDAAIARYEGTGPLLDFTSELQTSLAVRRAYAKLRARVMGDGEPPPEQLRARFRGAGTQIAILVGWDIYPEMRVQDRLLLRELQQRLLAWLRGQDATVAAGQRLWQDLGGCIEMFSLVNRRQELVEHDGALVRELLALDLGTCALSDQVRRRLRALEGLDRELDLVIACEPADPADLRDILERLAAQLGTGAAPAPNEVPW